MNVNNNKIIFFGYGYVAAAVAEALRSQGFEIIGTRRSESESPEGVTIVQFNSTYYQPKLSEHIDGATHLLVSIPPDEFGDSVIGNYFNEIVKNNKIKWIGYLSAATVYGDHAGNWVDEGSELKSNSKYGLPRIVAEEQCYHSM